MCHNRRLNRQAGDREGMDVGKLIAQFMKFGVVGVIAFVIDYGLLALLTEVFGVNYLVSATISFTVSVIFNYLASMRYVFTHKEDMSRRREFVIFVVLSVIGLIINTIGNDPITVLLGLIVPLLGLAIYEVMFRKQHDAQLAAQTKENGE